jgi:hypothetical protein
VGCSGVSAWASSSAAPVVLRSRLASLVALGLAQQQASSRQAGQLLVQAAGGGAGEAGQLAHVVVRLWVQQQLAQHLLAVVTQEQVGQHGFKCSRSRFDCSQIGFD